jgi:FKBP-type peptidyl-prolyl cis-trans isomerase 2
MFTRIFPAFSALKPLSVKNSFMKWIIPLMAIALIAGCVSQTPQTGQVVAKGDNVSVEYTGMFENGTIFDSSAGRGPLNFTVGTGQLITGFDNAVLGMGEGQEKTVTIPPEDAYGQYNPNKTVEIPRNLVPNETQVGDMLYSAFGSVRVLAIYNSTVMIDMNHPLAGKTLVFSIKVLSINGK